MNHIDDPFPAQVIQSPESQSDEVEALRTSHKKLENGASLSTIIIAGPMSLLRILFVDDPCSFVVVSVLREEWCQAKSELQEERIMRGSRMRTDAH